MKRETLKNEIAKNYNLYFSYRIWKNFIYDLIDGVEYRNIKLIVDNENQLVINFKLYDRNTVEIYYYIESIKNKNLWAASHVIDYMKLHNNIVDVDTLTKSINEASGILNYFIDDIFKYELMDTNNLKVVY